MHCTPYIIDADQQTLDHTVATVNWSTMVATFDLLTLEFAKCHKLLHILASQKPDLALVPDSCLAW